MLLVVVAACNAAPAEAPAEPEPTPAKEEPAPVVEEPVEPVTLKWWTVNNILARVQGALRSYALGLAPDRLVLYKNSRGYHPVASAPFRWQHSQKYELNLKVENQKLVGWITGGPELVWEDEEAPYLNGQIGLSNFGGCHTRFDSVALNPLGKISTT